MTTKPPNRDAPDSTQDVRAADAEREVQLPSMDEVLDRIVARRRIEGGSELAVEVIRDLRYA
jgi:hypothetical protein